MNFASAAKVRNPPFPPQHRTNTVATNYGSSYALEVTTAQPERVWT
jgi:hypothetical protein